jgi:hypothetical protein
MKVLPESAARRVIVLFVTSLLWTFALSADAYAQTDVIRGKVTGIDGKGLAAVRVTATSLPGNVTRAAVSNASGAFQIAFPDGPGDYIMGFQAAGYAYKQFEIKRLADEQVLIADTRLSPVQLDSLVVVAPVQQRPSRFQSTPDVSGTERPIPASNLPIDQQGSIAAMAASLPGVLLLPGLDGEPDAFSVLGLSGDQNSVTLNGLQTGADGLPRDAAVSSSLTTSPYDPSRGNFSGGNFNIQSRSGSNFMTRGMSFVLTNPQMQWTDRAAQALGNDYTNFSIGGISSGPIKMNKAFYNVSFQLGRQSRDNTSLLSTSALGLQTAGVAMDSVNRLVNILGARNVPTLGGPDRSSKLSDSGSLFGSVDFAPPFSASGQSFNLTFNGNWRRQTPVSSNQLALASSNGDNTNWSGGLQARHSGYLGLVLSETAAGINVSHSFGDPYLQLPAGRVRVNSLFDDGTSGVQSLTFGGNQGLGSSSQSLNGTFQNNLSWFDNANKQRIKLTTELNASGSTQHQVNNLLGTFNYNSLADLEAGKPSSFSRTLSAPELKTGQLTGSIALGDSWRKTQDLQFQYGLRVDASTFTKDPQYNPLIESTFGVRNDKTPSPVSISPRLGFSWTMGKSNEIAAFSGAAVAPRAILRGGIGVFSNAANSGQLGSVINNTGLPSGVQQIVCVGPAVPTPDWGAYANDPSTIPQTCADGTSGTVFSNGAPNVSLFANNFAPQKTIRTNMSWTGSALDGRFSLGLDGQYSLNRNQQRQFDLNFNGNQRFTLGDDGRPVFVNPSSIVPTTGAVASSDARVSQSFARVNEMRSDLESRTAQFTINLAPINRTPKNFGWSAAYTYSHIREQVSGFSSTAGNPLGLEWATSAQGPHQISYNLRYNFWNAVQVSWSGQFRSGSGYTPLVAGDVNGDGYANDRAFIYDANATDAALASGMSDLLASATKGTRECLEKQVGSIAGRNSCRGPWSSSASLNITIDRAKFRIPQRGALTFSLSNPLGGADLLLNGSDNLKGWGQTPTPDQSLLYVRGFDPATRKYKYEVNQRFGATSPQFVTLRSPVTLTAQLKVDLGPTREQQSLEQQLASGRTQPGSKLPEQFFRQIATSGVSNPLAAILRSQDSLRLTAAQADSIAAMNRRYTYRTDSLWAPIVKKLAALPEKYDEGDAYRMYLKARQTQIDMLSALVVPVREMLTGEQRRKLPSFITSALDPHYLALIRNGNSMYATSGSIGQFGGGAVPDFAFAASGVSISAGGGDVTIVRISR